MNGLRTIFSRCLVIVPYRNNVKPQQLASGSFLHATLAVTPGPQQHDKKSRDHRRRRAAL
ncbi:MAG: hypothetical protein WCE70_14220 [Rhodanobacteraceae bacterium]